MDQAITHDNLVSGPAWPAHPAFLAQFLELLNQYLAKHKTAAA
jgi:protease I